MASDFASRASSLPTAGGVINANLAYLLPQLAPSASIELISGFTDTCRLRYLGQLWRLDATERVLHVHKAVSSVQSGRHSQPTVATMAEAWRRIISEWDLGENMMEPELHSVCPSETSLRSEAAISRNVNHKRRNARG